MRPARGLVRPRSRARATLAVLLPLVVLGGSVVLAPPAVAAEDVASEEAMVESGSGADAVELDTTLYVPASAGDEPAPAVVLAHGFGGSKQSVADDALDLAERGYVVLTYSARGFGRSTGQIGLNDPRFEIADLSTLLDLLADRDEVQLDGDGDPRVGVAGRIELDLVPLGEEVEQRGEVRDLEPGVVQPDLPRAPAEPTGGVGEDHVAALGEVLRVGGDRLLAPAEPVREDHGGGAPATRGEVERRVQLDRVHAASGGHGRVLGPDAVGGGGRGGEDEQTADGQQEGQDSARHPGAGARAGTHEPAVGAHEAANGRRAARVPPARPVVRNRHSAGAGTLGQGCQSPVTTITRPGAWTSAGTSKKRGVGPWSWGNCSISWAAACFWFSSPSV